MTDPSQHPGTEAEVDATADPNLENAAEILDGAMEPDDEAQGPAVDGEVPAADAELAAARAEIEAQRDAVLRAQAEVENVRRRTAREVENAHKFALEKFAGQLLPVIDSLQKSLEEVDRHAGGDEAYGAIKEGIELSERIFRDTLAKFGVEQVDPLGEPFDPERHEAMSMVAVPSAEPNSVIDVLQKGYTLNGRLLRAAMVVVAKAPAA